MLGIIRRFGRGRRLTEALAPGLVEVLERGVPLYRALGDDEKRELQGLVNAFLAEKRFEGCDGLEITDEIRVTIAAQACVMLLGREHDLYPTVRTILVYPDRYVAPGSGRMPDGSVARGAQVRAGEAWTSGEIILSWRDVQHGAAAPDDGHNVVLHEFAHSLDHEDGFVQGAPRLQKRACYLPWARTMSREFAALRDDARWGRQTLLNTYGATNPAEFFAVLVETFFERPVALRERHPDLYDLMTCYFKQDPASRDGARS